METITPSDRVIQIRIPSQLPIVIKGNHIKADFSKIRLLESCILPVGILFVLPFHKIKTDFC